MKQSDETKDMGAESFQIKHLSALNEISKTVNSAYTVNEMLDIIVASAVRELDAEKCSLFFYKPGSQELVLKNSKGINKKSIHNGKFLLGEGVVGWVAENKTPLKLKNAANDKRFIWEKEHDCNVPMLCIPIICKDELKGVMCVEKAPRKDEFTEVNFEFLLILANQAAIAIDNAQLFNHLQKSYFDTISALANAVEAKDPYTLGHSERVTQYSITIGEQLGLSSAEIKTIQYAAILHDVGKIGVSGNILNKVGRLTFEEYCVIKQHSVIGENIIKRVDFLQGTRPIIRGHQERYDGSGYPDGLLGDEIPYLARILAIADVFDALTTDRPYRRAFYYKDAIKIIKESSGKHLDPKIVKVFLDIFS